MLRTASLYPLYRGAPAAAACFPELLRWVLAWWMPCGEDADPASLVLALDPTHHRDEWVALGWHPVLRYPLHITFRPTGGDRVPARSLASGLRCLSPPGT